MAPLDTKQKRRLRPLFRAVGRGDTDTVAAKARELLREIQSDMALLRKEAGIVRELLARYGGGDDRRFRCVREREEEEV